MGKASNKAIKQLVQGKTLSGSQQRMLWARVSALKALLVKKGLISDQEYKILSDAMLKDIENKVEKGIRETTGVG